MSSPAVQALSGSTNAGGPGTGHVASGFRLASPINLDDSGIGLSDCQCIALPVLPTQVARVLASAIIIDLPVPPTQVKLVLASVIIKLHFNQLS